MKFITFWEYDKQNEAALFEKFKTRPEAKINRLFPPCCLAGETRGFTLAEEEDIENLEEFAHHYTPYLRFKIHPIVELTKLIEIRKY